jgi:hypothetical protein
MIIGSFPVRHRPSLHDHGLFAAAPTPAFHDHVTFAAVFDVFAA